MKRAYDLNSGGPTGPAELWAYVALDYGAGGGASWVSPSVAVGTLFRVSQLFWRKRLRGPAKTIEWFMMMTVSSQLSPSAHVGPGLSLPHPVGIVLGGQVRIGRNVTIGQNVTLGSNYQRRRGKQKQPCVGDGVRISAGAVVVGPVDIGADALIGANAVVTRDVPSGFVARAARGDIVAIRASVTDPEGLATSSDPGAGDTTGDSGEA